MPDEVKIFGFAPSTFVRTVRLICEEKDAEHILLPLEFKQASHANLHPFMRMPIIRHGSVTLYETLAIASYLDGELSGRSLQPNDKYTHAIMLQWVSSACHYYYDNFVSRLLSEGDLLLRKPEEFVALLNPLDEVLERSGFVAGDNLSLADLFIGPQIEFVRSNPGGDELVRKCSNIFEWVSNLSSRSSFAKTAS